MALSAARGGASVLLLERARFPRDKICGDLVPFAARPILREYGLLEAVEAKPHALAARLAVYAGGGRLRVPAPADGLMVCRRLDLDDVLFQAARAAVDAREEHRVTALLRAATGQVCGVSGVTDAGQPFTFSAKVVAGADGYKSIVARQGRLYDRQPEHWAVATRAYYRGVPMGAGDCEVYYFSARRSEYLWIFPVDADTVNVGVGRVVGEAAGQPSLRGLHERLLAAPPHASRFAAAEQLTPIQGWNLPLASQRRPMRGDGFLLAGDAAGLIDPMWGHGIDTAMISGHLAGAHLAAIVRGDDYSAAALRGYEEAVWSRLGPGFAHALSCRRECVERGDATADWEPLTRLRDRCFAGAGELSAAL